MAKTETVNKDKVLELAKKYENDIVKFLRDIIAIPSTSCKEKEVVERIAKEMEKVKLDKVFIDDFGSVVGVIGNGKKKVLYDSHIDTVGIADPTAWKFDPFKGKYEDGIVYGRGASDNKAAIATMVYGMKIIKELGLESDVTLYSAGIVQEEDCDGLAVRSLIEDYGLKPDYVVLGECTNLDIYRGHRGRMEIKIVTKGVSCHASAPSRGDNAIYKMMPIVKGIEDMQPKLKDDKFLGKGTIAVTAIECKTGSYNVVPDECTIYIDRRLTVGETKETTIEELKSIKGAENAKIEILQYDSPSYKGFKKPVEKYFPTWVLPEEHELVKAGAKAAEMVRGSKPKIDKWVFSSDGVYTAGIAKIPTIGFGPSEEKWAHTVNDQVKVEHLVKAAAFYALFPSVLAPKSKN